MKTRVRVRLTAEIQVDIEVEHDEFDDPTDLNTKERNEAKALAAGYVGASEWSIEKAWSLP